MRRYVALGLALGICAGCHLRSGSGPSPSPPQLAAPPSAELTVAVSKLLHSAAAAEEDDPNKAEGALAAIAALGEPAIPVLTGALADADENVRLAAVQALAKFGTPSVVGPLLSALKDGSSEVRTVAVQALGRLRDRRALQPLLQLAQNDDTNSVRYDSLTALGQIGDPAAVPLLLAGTRDADPYVRMWSMTALCDMHDERAPDLALTLAHDANVYVRRRVLIGCGPALDTPRGHQVLIEFALSPDDLHTSLLARQDLARYRQGRPGAEELTEQMRRAGRRALKNRSQALSAALLLGDLRDPDAVDGLIAALRNSNYFVRALAAHQLGEIGERRAVPAVIKALGDSQDVVGAAAYVALQRFAQGGDTQARKALSAFEGRKTARPSAGTH
jgi:HEAT repeat protein